MAKVSWDDLTPISETPPKQVSWDDLTPIPQHYSFSHNVAAGFGNEFNNFINSGASGMQAIDQSLLNLHHKLFGGTPQTQPTQQLPVYPTSGTWGKLLGSGLALAAPYTGVEKAIGLGMDAAKFGTPALEKIPALAQKMIQSGGAMGATSFGTTPGSVRHRLASAALAAPLGVAGAGLGAALKPTGRAAHQIFGAAVAPLEKYVDNSLGRLNTVNPADTIGKAYEEAKNKVDYENLTNLAQDADKSVTKPVKLKQSQIDAMLSDPDLTSSKEANLAQALASGATPKKITFSSALYNKRADQVKKFIKAKAILNPTEYKTVAAKVAEQSNVVPQSYTQAMELKKGINGLAEWDNRHTKGGNALAKLAAGMLGGALDAQVAKNAVTPATKSFLKEWHQQRLNYGALQKFYHDPASGNFSPSLYNNLEKNNLDKVVRKFIPTKDDNADKINQFANLVGDQKNAEEMLLKKHLEGYTNKAGNIDALKLSAGLNQNKISPALKNLLTPEEKSGLTHIVGAQAMAKHLAANPTFLKRLSQHPFWTGGGLAALAHYAKLPIEGVAAMATGGMVVPRTMVQGGLSRAEAKAEQMLQRGEIEKVGMLGKPHVPPQSGPADRTVRALIYGTGVGSTNQPVSDN